ncbi:MAG: hypothetical protein ACKVP3_23045 [Hyphomicrobiaceae bacterium]
MINEVDHAARAIEKNARRLGNLIRRLSSNYDGEIVATVRAIRRTLAGKGRTLHDLAKLVELSADLTGCDPAEWRQVVRQLLREREQLTDWELRFVKTVSHYRKSPSTKQLDVLAGILRRLSQDAAHAA